MAGASARARNTARAGAGPDRRGDHSHDRRLDSGLPPTDARRVRPRCPRRDRAGPAQFLDQIGPARAAGAPGSRGLPRARSGRIAPGRTLDALQNAYRIGARIAWRRMAAVARESRGSTARPRRSSPSPSSPTSTSSRPNRSRATPASRQPMRASAERSHAAADRRAHRSGRPAGGARAARRGGRLAAPTRLAVLACSHRSPGRLAAIIGDGAIAARIEDRVIVLVPDPDAPGRRARIARSLGPRAAALGPAVPLERAHASLDRRRPLCGAAVRGHDPVDGPRRQRRPPGHAGGAFRSAGCSTISPSAAWAPLRDLTRTAAGPPAHHARSLAPRQGSIRETVTDLLVHPQTVRYRITRLRELFGDVLDDPDARFELALALAHSGGE